MPEGTRVIEVSAGNKSALLFKLKTNFSLIALKQLLSRVLDLLL